MCRLSKSAIVSVYPAAGVFAHWAVTVAGSAAPIGSPAAVPNAWGRDDHAPRRRPESGVPTSQERQHEEGQSGAAEGNIDTGRERERERGVRVWCTYTYEIGGERQIGG